MKKKLFALFTAVALIAALPLHALATEVDNNAGSGTTQITAEIAESYTITIPSATTVPETVLSGDELSFVVGTVSVTQSNLALPLVVSMETHAFSNANDKENEIPFTLQNAEGNTLTTLTFAPDDEDEVEITAVFEAETWMNAKAGTYTGSITFSMNVQTA